MKRFLVSILVVCMSISLAGCGDKSKTEKKTTKEGPGGTTTTTDSKEVKTTGDNPPKP